MLPLSPVQASESKKCRSRQKNRIGNSSKRMEITVEDKSHHAPLERVRIQIMSIKVEDSSRAHHTVLERVLIQHWLIDRWLITTYNVLMEEVCRTRILCHILLY